MPDGTRAVHTGDQSAWRYVLLVLLLLLVPIKSYYVAIPAYLSVLLLFMSFRLDVNRYAVALVVLLTFLGIVTTGRFLLLPASSLRDFTEVVRPFPVLVLFLLLHRLRGFRAGHLVQAGLLYLGLDAVLSIADFAGVLPGSVAAVLGVYHSDLHSSLSGWRTLGLSPGPGQHGMIGMVLFCIMLGAAVQLPERRLQGMFGAALALLIIVLSGSRTALAVAIAVFPLALLFSFREGRSARWMVGATLLGAGALAAAFLTMATLRSRARSILGLLTGMEVTAFTARQERWNELFDYMLREPLWAAVGWGKAYFGELSTVADNDWILLLMVGGVPLAAGFALAVGALAVHSAWSLARQGGAGRPFNLMVLLVVPAGIVSMATASFVSHPQVLMIFALLIAGKHHEDRRWADQTAGPTPMALRPAPAT